MNVVYNSCALDVLKTISDNSVDLIYTDPPFGTQSIQRLQSLKGSSVVSDMSYNDIHSDYIEFIRCHVDEMRRVLKPTGTLYLHLDHHCDYKVRLLVLDKIFGEENYHSSVIWSYDYGGSSKRVWRAKHDTILVYSKDINKHTFNYDAVDRIPYMSGPIRKGQKRDPRGKVVTDVWWFSIVGTNSKERTSYPTQKPIKLVERIIKASSNPGELILDPFAGSGTTGMATLNLERKFILCDQNPEAINIMKKRFLEKNVEFK